MKSQKTTKGAGRPKRTDKDNATSPSAEKGTKPGEKRKTYIVKTGTANKIDGIAYWDRLSVKEVVETAFTEHISRWEEKNGLVKVPAKK